MSREPGRERAPVEASPTEAKLSGTLAIDEQFQARRAEGHDVISLGAGQPDFPSPPAALKGGIEAIESGRTRYTPVAGTPELRAMIARKLKEENGLAVTANQVVVSAGAKQAIYHALLALVDPGDTVLVPTPAWPSYVEMVRLVGGVPVPIPLVGRARLAADQRGAHEGARGRLAAPRACWCSIIRRTRPARCTVGRSCRASPRSCAARSCS